MSKRNKYAFDRNELDQFIKNTELIIKPESLNRLQGGAVQYEQTIYTNKNIYTPHTFVNIIYMNKGG